MSSDSSDYPWGPPVDVLILESEEDFAAVQEVIRDAIQETARRHLYNTLDTFAMFHQAFRAQSELDLEQFTKISPVIHDENCLSCIGLSFRVMKYITEKEPSLSRHLFFVISNDYGSESPDPRDPLTPEEALLFDHFITVLQFSFNGRRGYFVADNSFLVDFPIVIMADNQPPHTGAFRSLSREGYRHNDVKLVNDIHAVWELSEERSNGERKARKRSIYLGRPFLDPDAIERRSKLIPFHGCILMGKGGFKAGLYVILGGDNRM